MACPALPRRVRFPEFRQSRQSRRLLGQSLRGKPRTNTFPGSLARLAVLVSTAFPQAVSWTREAWLAMQAPMGRQRIKSVVEHQGNWPWLCTPVRKITCTSVALASCRQQKECHSFHKGLVWLVDVKQHYTSASHRRTVRRSGRGSGRPPSPQGELDGVASFYSLPMACRSLTLLPRWASAGVLSISGCGAFSRTASLDLQTKQDEASGVWPTIMI
jgi:hypothetical protein